MSASRTNLNAMAPFATHPFATRLIRWTILFLSLTRRTVYSAAPTVEVNGTSIIGTSHTLADNVTVEFFGGKCRRHEDLLGS